LPVEGHAALHRAANHNIKSSLLLSFKKEDSSFLKKSSKRLSFLFAGCLEPDSLDSFFNFCGHVSRMHPSVAALLAARPALRADAMDGLLLEGVPLAAIAAREGTPCWVYGAGTIRRRFRRLREAMPDMAIHYAVKANDHLAIMSILAAEGAGADVVSAGEFLRARAAGISPDRIVFSGVGKTTAELVLALDSGIAQFNVESAEELRELSALAAARNAVARVALRVNPDVDAGTHYKISTGRAGDKFGIALPLIADLYAEAARLPGIAPVGLAVHIGSQIMGVAAYAAAYGKLATLVRDLRSAGMGVSMVDCGGGLGITYHDEPELVPEAWAGTIRATFAGLDLDLAIEPGRWLVGPAGVLLASVVRTKREGMARPIVVLDAAMNDLARPAMYGAWHGIVPVAASDLAAPCEMADIAGPVCESADIFGRAREIPAMDCHAVVAILDTGAYGAVMSSTYNARALAPQVLVDRGLAGASGFRLIRARQDLESLWRGEAVPERPGF
jgi:diaminopimelate decarboxylase